jgi:hypothetical protein
MALVQKMNADGMTFADLSQMLHRMVLKEGSFSRSDVLIYREQWMKDTECVNLGSASGTTFKTIQ